jgi:hypothetical protein
MPVYEREIVEQANAELLRQIEERLGSFPGALQGWRQFDSLTSSSVSAPNPPLPRA